MLESKAHLGKKSSTLLKYATIISNFQHVLIAEFGDDRLAVGQLRDIKVINSIVQRMKISASTKKKEKFKSSYGLKNYLSFVAQAIEFFNAHSGILVPINTYPFRIKIGRDIPRDIIHHAKVFSSLDLEKFEMYQPQSNRGKELELATKNLFLFQYYAGGLRWVDTILLTNHQFKGGMLKFHHLKTGNQQSKLFNFRMCETLSVFYSDIYWKIIHDVRVGNLKFDLAELAQLQRLVAPRIVFKMNLREIGMVEEYMVHHDYSDTEEHQFLLHIQEKMREKVTKRFFKEISERPLHFVFPFFQIEDFGMEEILTQNYSPRSTQKLHRKRTGVNNCLARICRSIGIDRMTCHSPRHTYARFLNEEIGLDEREIRKHLGHKQLSSTHAYLQNRHPKTEHELRLQQIMASKGYR